MPIWFNSKHGFNFQLIRVRFIDFLSPLDRPSLNVRLLPVLSWLCRWYAWAVFLLGSPDPLLLHPIAWCSPELKTLIQNLNDTYVNNVCCTHPSVESPCICGEPVNKMVHKLIPEDTFDPLHTILSNKKFCLKALWLFKNGSDSGRS
jgi:hypothetical protein